MGITGLHGCDQSGTTAQRPSNAPDGFAFFDTTLNVPIFYDETNEVWRDGLGRDITDGLWEMVGEGAPTDGTSGTGAGVAAPGCRYIDTSGTVCYINTGTKASPLWLWVGTSY